MTGMAIKPAKPEVQQHGQGEKDHIVCGGINKPQGKKKSGEKKKYCFFACLSPQNTPPDNSVVFL